MFSAYIAERACCGLDIFSFFLIILLTIICSVLVLIALALL